MERKKSMAEDFQSSADGPAIWMLGTSSFSAQLAAVFGTSYFTSAFHPHATPELAIQDYRVRFRPSFLRSAPTYGVALSGICARSKREASLLIQQHKSEWIKPTVVGTAEDWAAAGRQIISTTGTRDLIILDLAMDADARLATCHYLKDISSLLGDLGSKDEWMRTRGRDVSPEIDSSLIVD